MVEGQLQGEVATQTGRDYVAIHKGSSWRSVVGEGNKSNSMGVSSEVTILKSDSQVLAKHQTELCNKS